MDVQDLRDINKFELVYFDKGDYIIRQGDQADYAYFLLDGECRVCALNYTGTEIVYDYRTANNSIRCMIGGFTMYKCDRIHRSSFIAETKCACRKMERYAYRQYMVDHPRVIDTFIALVMDRWSILDDNFMLKQAHNTTGQVCAVVLSNLQQRGNEEWLRKEMNNSRIARFVGANRVTVVRIMSELDRLGVITKTDEGVRVNNRHDLEAYMRGDKVLKYRRKNTDETCDPAVDPDCYCITDCDPKTDPDCDCL